MLAKWAVDLMEHVPRDTFKPESYGMTRAGDGDVGFARSNIDDDISVIWEWLQTMVGECDQNMSDVTEEDIANALGGGEGGSVTDQKPSFAALDREIFSTLNASGGNQSTKNDTWSRRRFDEWRLQNGMPTSKAIETMDTETLASQLPIFFQQVMKHNGDHYPLESLLGFYRGFTRIMRKAQEARICETRVIETPFDMRAHDLFKRTGAAMLEAMRRSLLAGANKRRKKPSVVSWANEQALLTDKDHQASHPYGCFRRWTYYCISRFHIRGGKELYNVMDYDFHETRDESGDHIVYGERLSKGQDSALNLPTSGAAPKTSRGTVKRVKVEPLRVPVKCYQEDVIHTFRQFMKHQPVKVGDEVGKPRHLFLQPIGNPVTNAWFAKSHVSERVLISLFKTMAVVAGINIKDISSKPGRPILPSPVLGEAMPAYDFGPNGAMLPIRYGRSRVDWNADVQSSGGQNMNNISSDLPAGKRHFQEGFRDVCRKQEDVNQQSSGTSSARSEPDVACSVSGTGGNDKTFEGLADSDGRVPDDANVPSLHPGQSSSSKLQIARSQFKELEATLFDKMGSNGHSLRDTVQSAMTKLKELEATLLSIHSVS